jgi:hypothetical protein
MRSSIQTAVQILLAPRCASEKQERRAGDVGLSDQTDSATRRRRPASIGSTAFGLAEPATGRDFYRSAWKIVATAGTALGPRSPRPHRRGNDDRGRINEGLATAPADRFSGALDRGPEANRAKAAGERSNR